jgi:integrase
MAKYITSLALDNLKGGVKPNGEKTSKPYKVSAGENLFIMIGPKGTKTFYFDYRLDGKRPKLNIGNFPAVSLVEARTVALAMKQRVQRGEDPSLAHLNPSKRPQLDTGPTFEQIAREWHERKKGEVKNISAQNRIGKLENHVFKDIGNISITSLTTNQIANLLLKVEDKVSTETARRVKNVIAQVTRYARSKGLIGHDPASGLSDILKKVSVKHHASITDPKRLGEFLIKMDKYSGGPSARTAIYLTPILFLRQGTLRQLRWEHYNENQKQLEIPASIMKNNKPFVVPLPSQAIKALNELNRITGPDGYIFSFDDKPMSDGTVRQAMQRQGFSNKEVTPHGFRATARTLIREKLKIPGDIIERQLAHVSTTSLGNTYDRTEFLEDRTEMMQRWADYLDVLRSNSAPDSKNQ